MRYAGGSAAAGGLDAPFLAPAPDPAGMFRFMRGAQASLAVEAGVQSARGRGGDRREEPLL